MFRDEDEMPASGVLSNRLGAALDESRTLIVIASPRAAVSTYVNYEVDHFVSTRGTDQVVTIVVDGKPGGPPGREPRPAALRGSELLWLSCQTRRRLDRRSFLRVVAHVLGVDPDRLWRRDARRRRRKIASWVAVTVALVAVLGGLFWQQRSAEQRAPQRQQSAFEDFLRADLLESIRELELYPADFGPDNLDFQILRNEDLNGDGLTDYFVINRTLGFCGSGGCSVEVYVTTAPGEYRVVVSLLGSSSPRTRDAGTDGFKDILATDYNISGQPLYTVYRWDEQTYKPAHYEFCDGIHFEVCDPLVITPIDSFPLTAPGAVIRERPDVRSRPATIGAERLDVDQPKGDVIGVLPNKEWYLVNIWKGSAGFVEAQAVKP